MYEIYSYGNNDALVQVFNGIASLMGSGNYADLIRAVMLVSLFAAVIGGVFAARFNGFNWFIGMTLFYMVLFVPKVTVIVVDKLTGLPPVAVANVPIGLGFFAHFTSKIGDYLTTSFEAVFSLPNDLTYQTHGVLFGNKLIKKSMSWEIPDADMRENFLAFVKNCTYRDIQDGTIVLQTLNTSQDIWGTMSATNPGRVVILPTWPWLPMSCGFAYTILNANAPTMINDGLTRYGMQLNPQITVPAIAQTTLANQLQAATTNLLGIANTGQQTVMQNYMRNILAGGGVALAQQLGDPAATQIALAQAQAEATADLSGKTMANIAEEALPMVRNTVEVICYAVFPIVFLTFLLPMTAAITSLKGYLYTLLWVQLWPPLYAVLNLVLTLESQRQLTAIAANGWGLSIASMDSIANTAISAQSIAGYLVIAIPVIAAGLVKGMDSVMTGVAGAMTQPVQSATSSAGQAVGTGNLNYGNVSYETSSINNKTWNKDLTAPVHENPGMSTEINPWGTSVAGPGGFRADTDRTPSLAIKPNLSTSKAQSHTHAAQTATSSAFDEVASYAATHSKGDKSVFQWDTAHNANDEKLSNIRSGIHEKLSNSHGKDFADKNTDMMMYGAGGNIGLGVPKALTAVTGIKGGIETDFKNQHIGSQSEGVRKAYEDAQGVFKENGITTNAQFAETFRNSSAYSQMHSADRKLSDSVDAKLTTAKTESDVASTMEQLSYGSSPDVSMALQQEFDERGITQQQRVEHPEEYVGLANNVLERIAMQKVAPTLNLPAAQFVRPLSDDHNGNSATVERAATSAGVNSSEPSDKPRQDANAGLVATQNKINEQEQPIEVRVDQASEESARLRENVDERTKDTEANGTGLSGTWSRAKELLKRRN